VDNLVFSIVVQVNSWVLWPPPKKRNYIYLLDVCTVHSVQLTIYTNKCPTRILTERSIS